MRTLAFFNNKGGVGKTTLVYHLACMLADQGVQVLAVDLDPQANLTSMFVSEESLEDYWSEGDHPKTIMGSLRPVMRGLGDVLAPHVKMIGDKIGLIVGDLALSTFEEKLSDAWPRCHNRDEAAFRTMTAFHRMMRSAAEKIGAEWVLIDVGPNLGAINRSALIASRYVVVPLAPDLFSLQGLRNLGPSLRAWRASWAELIEKNPAPDLDLPEGLIEPIGYVIMQHGLRANRPPKAYLRWMERFPGAYRDYVLDQTDLAAVPTTSEDDFCLASLKHYRSLLQMAMDARKPVFALKPADGAIGAHAQAVQLAYKDFRALAKKIEERCGAAPATTA